MTLHEAYEVLGLTHNADAAAIESAYRKKASENHPDRFSGPERAKAERCMSRINIARLTLRESIDSASDESSDWDSREKESYGSKGSHGADQAGDQWGSSEGKAYGQEKTYNSAYYGEWARSDSASQSPAEGSSGWLSEIYDLGWLALFSVAIGAMASGYFFLLTLRWFSWQNAIGSLLFGVFICFLLLPVVIKRTGKISALKKEILDRYPISWLLYVTTVVSMFFAYIIIWSSARP